MAQKKRARNANGRFVKRSSKAATKRRAKRNPVAARTRSRGRSAPKAPAKRRSYQRNPARRGGADILDTFARGAMGAGGVLVGKAAVRSLPQLLSLPQAGNTGLAVQAATAVAVGWIADRFIGPDVAEMMLAGGLSAPMESLIIRMQVPWLSTALASTGTVAGYVPGRSSGNATRVGLNYGGRVAGYVAPPKSAGAAGAVSGYAYYN